MLLIFLTSILIVQKHSVLVVVSDKGIGVMVVVSKITHNEVCENKVFATMLF